MTVDGNRGHVAVVVPCRNAAGHLSTQLAALARQEVARDWEVIVVDNGSTDNTEDVARAYAQVLPRLRIVRERRRGRHHACNAGVSATDAPYVLFVDADDEVDDGYIDAMANALDRSPVVAASIDHERFSSASPEHGLVQTDGLSYGFGFLPYAGGGTLGARRAAIEAVGGFDDVQYAEDADLIWRLQLAGYPIAFVARARVAVRQRTGVPAMLDQHLKFGMAQAALYKRFRDLGMPRRPRRQVVADWRAAVLGVALGRSPAERYRSARRIGRCVGRLIGSAKYGVWYP